ncbi:MAG: hypothetical protein ABIU30_22955 [Ferruginibacter sp.]
MALKKRRNNFRNITPILLLLFFSSCNSTRSRKIKFEDFASINDSTNIYIYKKLHFLHESGESYLAIGKSFCDVYNNENATLAEATGFAQIDTVISGKIRIASGYEITFYKYADTILFETRKLKHTDALKRRLNYVFMDTCK